MKKAEILVFLIIITLSAAFQAQQIGTGLGYHIIVVKK